MSGKDDMVEHVLTFIVPVSFIKTFPSASIIQTLDKEKHFVHIFHRGVSSKGGAGVFIGGREGLWAH